MGNVIREMLLNRLLSSVGYLSLLLKDGMILTLFASNHSDNGNRFTVFGFVNGNRDFNGSTFEVLDESLYPFRQTRVGKVL